MDARDTRWDGNAMSVDRDWKSWREYKEALEEAMESTRAARAATQAVRLETAIERLKQREAEFLAEKRIRHEYIARNAQAICDGVYQERSTRPEAVLQVVATF